MRRALPLGLAATALVAVAASPGWAHSGVNANKSLRSELVSAPHGVSVSVAPDGSSIKVSSTSPLTVLGYSGEPFLRFSGGRVVENTNSLTLYDARPGVLAAIPAGAGHAAPAWRSAGSSYSWSDRRTVWAGTALPAAVMEEPKQPHLVSTWTIPVRVDGREGKIRGRVVWVPPSDSVGLTVAVCLGFLLAVLVAAALAAFPRRRA